MNNPPGDTTSALNWHVGCRNVTSIVQQTYAEKNYCKRQIRHIATFREDELIYDIFRKDLVRDTYMQTRCMQKRIGRDKICREDIC